MSRNARTIGKRARPLFLPLSNRLDADAVESQHNDVDALLASHHKIVDAPGDEVFRDIRLRVIYLTNIDNLKYK